MLDPSTIERDLEQFAMDTHKLAAKCSQLKAKQDSCASFIVEVMCEKVADFYSPEKWPAGIYLRKIFNEKA